MIFGSIGLLLVAGGLLAAGIAKSSTGFLALSLVCTGVAGMLLIVAYAAARGATGLNTGRAATPGDGFAPAPGPGVVYVPVSADQLDQLVASGALTGKQPSAKRK